MQGVRIGKAYQGDAGRVVEGNRPVVAVAGDRHVLDVSEAPGADIDSISVALTEIVDVVVTALDVA